MSATTIPDATTPPPPPEVPVRFELVPATVEPQPGQEVSHYDRTQIRTAKAGQAVAVVREGNAPDAVGDNVALDADGATIVAKVDGRVLVRHDRVHVDTALEVHGNVDFSTGNVDFPGDVVVRGTVLDLFKVHGGGSVFVGGAVEGAEIRAARDLVVKGSIVAKDRGSCTVGGSVRAKYVTNARVEAGGDVLCEAAIANSTVVAAGAVRVKDGPIIAGKTTAGGGIYCRALGAPSGVMTVVEAGVDDALRREIPEILAAVELQRQKARKIEQTVQPLLANQKNLTPAQKEKATELLFEAKEMTGRADAAANAFKARHAAMVAKADVEISVAEVLHHGVVIRFPGLQTRIMTDFKGPLKIQLKKVGNERRILLVTPSNQSTQYLGGETLPDPFAAALAKLG